MRNLLTYFIALVWLVNGLCCKVLNLVPRHEQIVARILGEQYARPLTLAIGISEIAMAIWIISGIRPKFNAILQMGIIAVMNLIEFLLAADLLLWGRLNALFALIFILLIYYTAFKRRPRVA
ncbi:DoxX-like family protein [Chitinophaga sancti]|uniref:DoxX-like family protein n=1 Tax=Chitinophaga sancti TaxID=1004 RepID=A0A1K1SXI1_9BACT|nr:DoxX-like family protein [Chitinophaga sancti]WQD62274.1 DoxX-like family protein [Chitinophaga sancti]WQG92157.1 DoxX-like family protein [Chitinophaga sancti]SFW88948.1 DoxX-like family protein [Chitinophaga sancti]